MRKLIIMFMAALSPLLLAQSQSEVERPVISVRAEVWPSFTHKDGSGYYFELLRALYEPLGYQVDYKICPWKRCLRDVVSGQADVVVGLYEEEWGDGRLLNKPKYPVFLDRVMAVYKKSANIEWRGQETLSNEAIVQSRGFDYHHELDVPVKNNEVSSITLAWRFMAAGRAQFMLSTQEEVVAVMAAHHSDADSYELKEVFSRHVYFGYPATAKGDALLGIAEEYLPQLHREGIIQKLLNKWQLSWAVALEERDVQR